jgi:hypothetical protein
VNARLLVGLLLAGTVAVGTLAYRRRDPIPPASAVDPDVLDPPAPWTLLAFTSALCTACEDTPGVIAEALDVDEAELDEVNGPVAVELVDVAERPGLAEALDVDATPTVALVDHEGRVRFA